jgi:hypothetical protein
MKKNIIGFFGFSICIILLCECKTVNSPTDPRNEKLGKNKETDTSIYEVKLPELPNIDSIGREYWRHKRDSIEQEKKK